jgi:hypothetical protein
LAQMPISQLFPLWQNALHTLSLRSRKDVLADIKALVPVIFVLGGEAVMGEVAGAIGDVARWWR